MIDYPPSSLAPEDGATHLHRDDECLECLLGPIIAITPDLRLRILPDPAGGGLVAMTGTGPEDGNCGRGATVYDALRQVAVQYVDDPCGECLIDDGQWNPYRRCPAHTFPALP